MTNNDFELTNLPIEAQDEEINKEDFKLVDNSKRVHEQKFLTKPTTFFKDSLKRFSKNKSSVVAAGILGTLLLLSFAVPIIDRNDTKKEHPEFVYLEPKLFNAGSGFWDGTKEWEQIAVDVGGHPDATTDEEKEQFWWPSPEDFKKQAVSNRRFTDVVFTSNKNKYAHGGYIQFGRAASDVGTVEMSSPSLISLDINDGDIYLKNFETYDLNKLKEVEGEEAFFPNNYIQGKASLEFEYYVDVDDTAVKKSVTLLNEDSVFSVSSLNLTDIIKADPYVVENNITTFKDVTISLVMEKHAENSNECVLIKSLEFETSNSKKTKIEGASFNDANEMMIRSLDDEHTKDKYWSCTGYKKLHMAKVIYCDFTYDSYEAVFGTMEMSHDTLSMSDIFKYKSKNWLEFDYVMSSNSEGKFYIESFDYEVKSEKCPLKEIKRVTCDPETGEDIYVDGIVEYYRYYGYDSMPRFLLGTDKAGRDMFKYVFEGLRTSLLLGIISFVICFVIGLIYGSISGYFGGNVDLVMERITDILSGLPWIVVMTLVILHLGQNVVTFGLAICLTGWIGTASLTRTQFYRFRGREYVLASRSLGASDARLIAKHILPNAMGTIITSAVLMIPSVIFSEATISYLGLGLKGTSSLGVILSDNQTQLTIHPYLLIFPAIVIALLMISFNLFGNGLRDAVNPSLKGEEQ